MVIKDPGLGDLRRPAAAGRARPATGQLVTSAEDMPQLPFSHFRLHFREGGRAPLVTPPGCGSFETEALLYPWSGNPPVTIELELRDRLGPTTAPAGPGRPPLPRALKPAPPTTPPGATRPLTMRITRGDGEQDITKVSTVLPPGVVGKIAGVPYCPEAGIARAKSRSGEHGGVEERDDPSCPAASQVGATTRRRRRRLPAHLRPRLASTSPAPTTATRSRLSRSPRPSPAPSTPARWSCALRSPSTR